MKKAVYDYAAGAWTLEQERLFVYDGWNLIEEIRREGGTETSRYFVWGQDLSQSLQGAGGIGGLVAEVDGSGGSSLTYYFCYDGNGNVGQVVNAADGSIAAAYEYDPYGKMLKADGVKAGDNPFRFSTKYWDDETGLGYWGYRYYSSELGRWVSRDPIGETGGINLYCFVVNGPANSIDPLGYIDFNKTVYDWHKSSKELGDYYLDQANNSLKPLNPSGYIVYSVDSVSYYLISVILPANEDEAFLALISYDIAPAASNALNFMGVRAKNIYYRIFRKCNKNIVQVSDNIASNFANEVEHKVGNETKQFTSNLIGSIKDSFKGGNYEELILDKDVVAYRASNYVESGSVGDFFGDTRPLNSLDAEELYNIRKWGNNATNLGIYRIKAGTRIYYGGVEGGAGNQLYIPDATKVLESGDINLIETDKLFISAEKALTN